MTALLTLAALFAVAADPPDEDARLAAVKRWRQQYEHLAANLDEQIARLEAKGTDPAGLRKARAAREALKRNPFDHPRYGWLVGESAHRPQIAGQAAQIPGQPARVVKKDGDAWVVEVRHAYVHAGHTTPEPEILTLRLTDLPESVKPRVGVPLKLPGLWLVTAGKKVAAKPVLTVTPLVVRPEEMPEECRPKKKGE